MVLLNYTLHNYSLQYTIGIHNNRTLELAA